MPVAGIRDLVCLRIPQHEERIGLHDGIVILALCLDNRRHVKACVGSLNPHARSGLQLGHRVRRII